MIRDCGCPDFWKMRPRILRPPSRYGCLFRAVIVQLSEIVVWKDALLAIGRFVHSAQHRSTTSPGTLSFISVSNLRRCPSPHSVYQPRFFPCATASVSTVSTGPALFCLSLSHVLRSIGRSLIFISKLPSGPAKCAVNSECSRSCCSVQHGCASQ